MDEYLDEINTMLLSIFVDTRMPISDPISYAEEQNVSEAGFPILGNPDAPLKLQSIESFICMHCGNAFRNIFPILMNFVNSGEMSIEVIPLYSAGHYYNSERVHSYAHCMIEQGVYWEYRDILYRLQEMHPVVAFLEARLIEAVKYVGGDVEQAKECVSDGNLITMLDDTVMNLFEDEIYGTPFYKINGEAFYPSSDRDELMNQIEEALKDLNKNSM